jgi:hypothetical protein
LVAGVSHVVDAVFERHFFEPFFWAIGIVDQGLE